MSGPDTLARVKDNLQRHGFLGLRRCALCQWYIGITTGRKDEYLIDTSCGCGQSSHKNPASDDDLLLYADALLGYANEIEAAAMSRKEAHNRRVQ